MIEGGEGSYTDNRFYVGASRERASSIGSGSCGSVEKWPSIKSLPSLEDRWNPDAQREVATVRDQNLRWSPDVPWSGEMRMDSWNPDAPMAQKLGLECIPEDDKLQI